MRERAADFSAPPGAVDVARRAARQRRDDGPSNFGGHDPDGLGVRFRRDRESRLDDIDTQLVELAGEPQLLVDAHREAGRLLTIPQGRVEDDDGRI